MISNLPRVKITRSKEFLTRLWNLQNDDRPGFQIGYLGPRVKGGKPIRSALFSTDGIDTVRDRLKDPEKYIKAQLTEIDDQLNLPGEFVPSLCPALGVIGIASAFGCPVIWWENDFPSVQAIINDVFSDVRQLNKPATDAGELARILEYSHFFIDKTKRKFPLRLTDIQGPLDNAGLICGHNNLFSAMLSHPEEVHHLMRLITDVTIDFVKVQKEIANKNNVEFVPAMFQPWLPDGMGISIANDDWVMISAEMHDQFHLPYINELSEEFGGVYIHSCGNWSHQFESLDKVHRLRGIEFGASEVPYKDVLERFGGKTVLACRIGFNRDLQFQSMFDFVYQILNACKTYRGLFINVDVTNGLIDENWPATDLNEIYKLIGLDRL
jgi:uroporphyrinogen-III decarboxylase